MSDVVTCVKQFRRDVPRPAREEILRQHRSLEQAIAQIAAVPASVRSTLYYPALWVMAAKYLEAPRTTPAADRDRLLRDLSALCGLPYDAVVRDMAAMVKKLDADHDKWKRRRRANHGLGGRTSRRTSAALSPGRTMAI